MCGRGFAVVIFTLLKGRFRFLIFHNRHASVMQICMCTVSKTKNATYDLECPISHLPYSIP